MRLATVRLEGTTSAVRIDGDEVTVLDAPDVGALLAKPDWRRSAAETVPLGEVEPLALDALDYGPLVPRPGRIVCVGQNYREHIAEMGGTPPEYPTLFAKYASSLVGATDDIRLPRVSTAVDWEAELAIVIGAGGRYLEPGDTAAAIAGWTVANDVSMRDWQRRTSQFLQGKTFDASTPVGPVLVTADEFDPEPALAIRTRVNGEVRQESTTRDMLFGPHEIVAYISQFTTLEPGDLILTGTPSGVGAGRDPQVFLADGDVVETEIEGIGVLRNRCVAD